MPLQQKRRRIDSYATAACLEPQQSPSPLREESAETDSVNWREASQNNAAIEAQAPVRSTSASTSMATSIEPNNAVTGDTEHPSRWRVSTHQLEILASCMEQLPPLALSRARTREALEDSQRRWDKIASALNTLDPRCVKSGRQWARYWIDVKFKLRRKYAALRREGRRCSSSLSPFEQRMIKILTDDEGNLLPTAAVTGWRDDDEDFPAHDEDSAPPVQPEQVDVTRIPEAVAPKLEDNLDSTGSLIEDPIDITKKTSEELQQDILRFNLRRQQEMHEFEMTRQKEMHELEKRHVKARHKIELEILELKKKRLLQDYDRNRQLHISIGRVNGEQ